MKKLILRISKIAMLWITVLVSSQVFAYKMISPNAKCNLSAEQRKDPDLVVRDYLEIGHLYCGNSPWIEDDNHFKNPELIPKKSYTYFFEKYGKNVESSNAYFKEFKIIDSRKGGSVDGRPTLIYRTEILYVLITASYIDNEVEPLAKGQDFHSDVNYINREMAVCEKVTVDIVVGDTPWGWYKLLNPSIGTNMSAYYKQKENLKNSDIYKKYQLVRLNHKKEVERYTHFASQCKINL